MSNEFEMRDMGQTRSFLCINIERDRKNGILTIKQRRYPEDVFQRFVMINCNPCSTPVECQMKLESKAGVKRTTKPYTVNKTNYFQLYSGDIKNLIIMQQCQS